MTSPNEFSRVVKLDMLGSGDVRHEISADEAERAALCERFGLLSLDRLTATLSLTKSEKGIKATGSLIADLTQACTATGEAVADHIDEAIELLFVPEPAEDGEVELDEEECESMFHDGKVVDIGEAAAQTMGLALNPYPRSPNADQTLRAAGVKSEEEEKVASGPFAALAALKDRSKS
jgi:uncharacterized metal-binding protein YceD (DUF177 family)